MSLSFNEMQILGWQIQDELRAERASREHMAYLKAYSEQAQRIAESRRQQDQLDMQREAQEQNFAYMALAYAPRRTAEKPNKVIVVPSIDVVVDDRLLEYFMTNDQVELVLKLDELGFRPWTISDWFLNLVLAPTVRSAMERKGALFSICLDTPIMNYWNPSVSPVPFSCYLNESMFKEE